MNDAWERVIAGIGYAAGNCRQSADAIAEHADELKLINPVVVGAQVARGGEHWWCRETGSRMTSRTAAASCSR